MGLKNKERNQSNDKKKLDFFTIGTIFPTKKGDKGTFKPKIDKKYGVKAVTITLNNGDEYELDENMLVLVSPKTITTKTGKMDILELSLGI